MKRFYKDVTTAPVEGGWQVFLDGRAMKTQGGKAQVVPVEALAEVLAAEWREQGEEIDPAAFPMRDMVDYGLDRVAQDPAEAIDAIMPYGDTDTLCYRADEGDSLRQRQDEAWEPMLAAVEGEHGVTFARAGGVLHAPHPQATLPKLRAHLEKFDPLTLVAVQNMAALASSLCVALTALKPDADVEALFGHANLEEDWQARQWGWDNDALARRDARLAGFRLAAELARLVRG